MIQGQSSLKDLLFFHQIMAACKNSANPNGPVARSRIKPSFFICYTLERLWPLPQPKRLRCDIVHGHLVFTKTTYVKFERILYAKIMKKNLLKTTFTKKLEKVTKFFNISKTYKSKEKFPSTNRVSRCSQNNRQVRIGKET